MAPGRLGCGAEAEAEDAALAGGLADESAILSLFETIARTYPCGVDRYFSAAKDGGRSSL